MCLLLSPASQFDDSTVRPPSCASTVTARVPWSACERTCHPWVNADATLSWLGAESTKLETRLVRRSSVSVPP